MDTRNFYKLKIAFAFGLSFVLTVLLIAASPAKAQSNEEPYRVEEFVTEMPSELFVRTSGGHITVEPSDSDSFRVEMFVRQNGEYLTANDTDLEDYEIDISQNGNTVTAEAKHPDDNSWKFWNRDNISISFVVYAPSETSSELRTSGGNITAKGLDGNQEVRTSGGHLDLVDLSGNVNARTSGGHINISNFEGELAARTSGGHIDTNNANGVLDLRTSGGHITLKESSGSTNARTSGGNISADMNSVNEFVELRTSGGSIDITLPTDTGFDLALRGNRVPSELKNFSGEITRNKLNGQINGGGPKISARTSGGSVDLNYQ